MEPGLQVLMLSVSIYAELVSFAPNLALDCIPGNGHDVRGAGRAALLDRALGVQGEPIDTVVSDPNGLPFMAG